MSRPRSAVYPGHVCGGGGGRVCRRSSVSYRSLIANQRQWTFRELFPSEDASLQRRLRSHRWTDGCLPDGCLHCNILLAPLDNVQALCDLTPLSMNASFTGKRTRERLPRRGEVRQPRQLPVPVDGASRSQRRFISCVWCLQVEKQQVTDAMGGNGIKDVSTGEVCHAQSDSHSGRNQYSTATWVMPHEG